MRSTPGADHPEVRQPTPDECMERAQWTDDEGFRHMAFWWPQMGGYVGTAVARMSPETNEDGYPEGCLTVWVWHRGDFPFTEGDRGFDDQPLSPAVLHICSAEDWARMWERLVDFENGGESR